MKIQINRPGISSTCLNVQTIFEGAGPIGRNRPVAFILPGGPGADQGSYARYACLQEVVDLVFHDPRGCGESDKGEASSYNMDNYINDVEAIREYFSLDKIIVIGKSYGSMCALGYTVRFPERVEKLVLAAGAPSYRFFDTAKATLAQIGTPEQIKICEKAWRGDFQNREEMLEFFRLTNPLYSIKARTKSVEFDLEAKSMAFAYDVLNEGFRQSLWHFDYENDLAQIECPTLVLAGREDWINHYQYAEQMARAIPHSQLVIFENAGHSMEVDVGDLYFETIADFIA